MLNIVIYTIGIVACVFVNGFLGLHVLPRARYKEVWKKHHGAALTGEYYAKAWKLKNLWFTILFPREFHQQNHLSDYSIYDCNVLYEENFLDLMKETQIGWKLGSLIFGLPCFLISCIYTPILFALVNSFNAIALHGNKFINYFLAKFQPLTSEMVLDEVERNVKQALSESNNVQKLHLNYKTPDSPFHTTTADIFEDYTEQ